MVVNMFKRCAALIVTVKFVGNTFCKRGANFLLRYLTLQALCTSFSFDPA
jgi:hypothetical protein